jgi:plastocyanin
MYMFYLEGRPKALEAALLVIACVLWAAVSPARAQTVSVSLSLAKYDSVKHGQAGDFVGVSPGVVHVHVGDQIVFVNEDVKSHTVTALPDSSTFPDDPHWTDDVLRQSGAIGAGTWSTGELKPGASSRPIAVKKSGKYLYGCFYDYSAGMRGEIIVDP